jgi:serine/threonine protein kinase
MCYYKKNVSLDVFRNSQIKHTVPNVLIRGTRDSPQSTKINYKSSDKHQELNNERIKILHNLGGSFINSVANKKKSRLYITSDKNGKRTITRVIKKDVDREFEVYKVLKIHNHANLMKYLGFCEDDGFRFYRYEFYDGDSLRIFLEKEQKYGPIKEILLKQIFYQIVIGLIELHRLNIAHCDIKPDNIIISNGIVKIIDYDLSLYLGENKFVIQNDIIGTTKYISPECTHIKVYSKYTDMWSLGILFYQMVTRHYPFSNAHYNENYNFNLMRESMFKNPEFEYMWTIINKNKYDPEIGEIIIKLLSFKDINRGTAEELLKYKWMKQIASKIDATHKENNDSLS